MKITLINGSPKAKDSASGLLLDDLRSLLQGQEISEVHLNRPFVKDNEKEVLLHSEVLVFAFPLYSDNIPSHILGCLWAMEELLKAKSIYVYGIVNNGFYEGSQNAPALEVLRHWSNRTGLVWGQGVGVGTGGMIVPLKKVALGKGPKKNLGKAFGILSENILAKRSADNLLINANFPRFLYKYSAHRNWNAIARANGLQRKDLYRKIEPKDI